MSEAHGERRHQQRPPSKTEESRHRRGKEAPGEHTREQTKQVNTDTDTNLGHQSKLYTINCRHSVLSIDILCRR